MMSTSVCGSVCLSLRISPEPHERSLPIFFVHVACVRGLVLRHVDDRPHRLSPGRDFFSIDNALYSIGFGTHTKMTELIDIPFCMMSGLGPTNGVLHWVMIPEGEQAISGKTCPTSLTLLSLRL